MPSSIGSRQVGRMPRDARMRQPGSRRGQLGSVVPKSKRNRRAETLCIRAGTTAAINNVVQGRGKLVNAQIINGVLELRVRGLHKLWAMKDSIQIPLASIEIVRMSAERARAGPEGTRNPGTSIPGVLNAGSFNAGVYRTFWDVHNPDNAISIRLRNDRPFAGIEDRYDELIVEVENPAETRHRINRALS
jgi:hypothetical protein